jgi:hypothetical protein
MGYVNPSVSWVDAGNSWVCNLCNMTNDVPSWYFCSLDGTGQRLDRSSRPELQFGSVDLVVNQDYCIRDMQVSGCRYIYTYIHTHIHTHTQTYTHTYTHTHKHKHINTHIHTHIHTHTHTYIGAGLRVCHRHLPQSR